MICLGRGIGVQIGVHNIAPCFVLRWGTGDNEFSEGGNMENDLVPAEREKSALVGWGEGIKGEVQEKLCRAGALEVGGVSR